MSTHLVATMQSAARPVSQLTIALTGSSGIGRYSLLTGFGPPDIEIIATGG